MHNIAVSDVNADMSHVIKDIAGLSILHAVNRRTTLPLFIRPPRKTVSEVTVYRLSEARTVAAFRKTRASGNIGIPYKLLRIGGYLRSLSAS